MERGQCEPGEEETGDFLNDAKLTNSVRGEEMKGCVSVFNRARSVMARVDVSHWQHQSNVSYEYRYEKSQVLCGNRKFSKKLMK